MRIALAVAGFLLLALTACTTGKSTVDDSSATPFLVDKPEEGKVVMSAYEDPTPDWTWDLIAGQNNLAGTVSVYNDEDHFYVTYETGDNWPMSEAHLYIGSAPEGKGAPGRFPYKEEFDPPVHSYTFEVSLEDDLPAKSMIYIAAHASVGMGANHETAWGGYWNNGLPNWDWNWAKKWGGGFTTRVMPMPELPDDQVTYRGAHYGTYSYWGVEFTNPVSLPPGSYTENGHTRYVGWCFDHDHYMYANYPYNVTLYSTYDTDIPTFGQNNNWDLVNYMLTQRRNNGTGIWDQDWTSNGIKNQFQAACWKFSNGVDPAAGSLAEAFVDDAIANGDNFIPGPGEFYGIILYPDTNSNNQRVRAQMNIIEIDP